MLKAPELRFPEFTDDWEERKLKDVVEKQIKGKAQFEKLAQGDVEYLDTSRLNGGQSILTNGLKDVTLDDILILWDGSKAGTVYHGFEGALGSTLKAYRTSANSKFVYQYLKRHQDNIYINYRTPNIPHVQKDFLNVFTISVPGSDEQAKIGSFFKQLDNTIALHQRKLDLLKEQKKGYLQKMFPKNGAKVPELRFAGFADDWEERKLGDLGSVAMNKRIFKEQTTENGEVPFFKIGTFGSEPDAFISRELFEEYKSKYPYPVIGDILISASGSIGRTVVYQGKDEYFQDSNIVWLKHDNQLDNQFLKQFYSIVKWQGLEGSTIKRLYNKNILDTPISIPTPNEQQKIGSFFKQLDNTITLHQRKLDLLKEQKKGFLQKMFL
ncbi:restriction endonuclease subunit S [Lactococcus cremoris]|uniref:restriction endonuclease subunit S n=1 Tax=Lactococcus lactis subsp. cremoris TaxID=1359 RepID=UPI003D2F594B